MTKLAAQGDDSSMQSNNTPQLDWLAYDTQMFRVIRGCHLTGRMKRSANVEFTTPSNVNLFLESICSPQPTWNS
ncbi:hypothetical protein K443DRAFT_178289 [Laccaria amethystina LaAM-08-1]|uniref:Uncharacterized protein n=1 Tax=Laccaria amethystina LaAM-08-1 TaxID=1095629 RepID=A0A0C9XTH7_9AGAR|nr:hypothetical protein K443DRAFT_178289 [Laccaria amethystina LaAM-08-1]